MSSSFRDRSSECLGLYHDCGTLQSRLQGTTAFRAIASCAVDSRHQLRQGELHESSGLTRPEIRLLRLGLTVRIVATLIVTPEP